MDDKKKWVFKTAANDSLMAEAIIEHMVGKDVKTLGFIGFADAYGDSWLSQITPLAEKHGIKLVVTERFNSKDNSVTGQVLRLTAANPDAVLVAGSGTPAALPHRSEEHTSELQSLMRISYAVF